MGFHQYHSSSSSLGFQLNVLPASSLFSHVHLSKKPPVLFTILGQGYLRGLLWKSERRSQGPGVHQTSRYIAATVEVRLGQGQREASLKCAPRSQACRGENKGLGPKEETGTLEARRKSSSQSEADI